MKTETIQLLQGSYVVPAEIGGFLMTCSGCGCRVNLYDIYNGLCPWCEGSMKKQRNRMIRILRVLDYEIDQKESGNVIVPDDYLPTPVLQHWMEHPEEITGKTDIRKLVRHKELHEGERTIRAWCAVCIGGGYAKALQDHDPEKGKSILLGLATAEEEKFIKFSLHKALDELVESWPRQTKLLQTAQEQIRESFSSPYIQEVLQRLEV